MQGKTFAFCMAPTFTQKLWKAYNQLFRKHLRIDDYGYGLYAPKDFNGVWEVYWPNGRLKFRAEYVNGKEEGWTRCWWDNGKLCQEGVNEAGECVGIWTRFLEDGRKFKEEEFYSPGSFDVRVYNGDMLLEVKRFRNWLEI
jgi:antitoxin component YwqK of YwqJK toxin-antitoxin module